jgi:O-antigen ligase
MQIARVKEMFVALVLLLPWVLPVQWGPVTLMGQMLAATTGFACSVYVGIKARRVLTMLLWAGLINAIIAISQVTHLCSTLFGDVALCHNHVAHGFLNQRNHLASLSVLSLWACVFSIRTKGTEEPLNFATCVAIITLSAACAFTASRIGGVELGFACAALWWFKRGTETERATRRALVTAVLSYVAASVVLILQLPLTGQDSANAWGRFVDSAAYSRLALWSNILELIAQSPWTGHGWRSLAYLHYSTDFSSARFMEMLDNAHNLPLHLAVELGVPVALGFCALVVWALWRGKPWTETRSERQLAWGILLVIGLHSLVEYPLWSGLFWMTALLAIGILTADFRENWLVARSKYTRNAISFIVKGAVALILMGTAVVALDYHRVSQIYLSPDRRTSWYGRDAMSLAQTSVLFQSHAKFAELQITSLSKDTAQRTFVLSSELVRWSPEPRIIEKLIESAVMLGHDDIAAFHMKRYSAAYPAAYAVWVKRAAPTSEL